MPNTAKHLIGSLQQGNPVTDDFDYGRVMVDALSRANRANAYTPPADQTDVSFIDELNDLHAGARHATGYQEHVAAGGLVTGVIPTPAVRMRTLDIRTTRIAERRDNDEYVFHPSARLPGESNRLSASIILNSLVSQAGARLIVTEERPAPNTGNVMAFYKDAGVFRLVEAAAFAHVADGDEVTEGAQPFMTAPIPMDESFAYAFRTKVTRADLRNVGGGRTLEAVAGAISLGLANLADKILLDAVVATTPDEFSLSNAAARGLRFHELKALVGTTAAGATVDDRRLNVQGVPAELTSAHTATVVGAFNRAAVAVYPIVQIHIERINLNGDVFVTSWANMIPLIPDATAFWTVS